MDRKFIKKNDAMIVWNIEKINNTYCISELAVYEYTNKERKIFTKGLYQNKICDEFYEVYAKLKLYDKFQLSIGNCSSYWKKLNKDQTIAECYRLLFDYPPKDLKLCLLELGKIDYLESMRLLAQRKFYLEDKE